MLFHIQFRGPGGWEPVGSGVGYGPQREIEAVRDLDGLAGGLPSGRYRVIAARTGAVAGTELKVSAGEIVECRRDDPGR